jgi:hypothetical protein
MATKQSSSYPLPGVSLPNVNYGQYSQPRRGRSVAPGAAMVNVLQGGQKLTQQQEEARRQEEERKRQEQQQVINRMQQVQTNADLWNLEQMSNMNTMPQTSAIDDQLQATLQKRLDIATQAQVYLKTQFGDKEARKSAQKAINDYYDLLTLTKQTTTNFGALGSYWKEKAPTIGSAITIIGNDENEIANNQYFVNALGGVYDDARFEMIYDEANNDIMIKVSGYEHDLVDGKMVQGAYREKIMSARAFNARTGEGKDFGFVSTVPQVVNETIKKLYPSTKTPEGDGLGILNDRGVLSDKYWSGEAVTTTNLNDGYISTAVNKQLNIDLLRKDMIGLIKQKIGGVVSTGPQQLANFWNIDLKNLNKGFENSYQNLLPDNATMEEALFNTVLENLTSYDGITKDENGNIFMQTNKSITKPSVSSGPEGPLDYRVNTLQEVITLNSKQPSSAIASVMKKLTNKELYNRDQVYDVWLNMAPAAELKTKIPTNKEYYDVKELDPVAAFNKMDIQGELFEVKNGQVISIEKNYDFSKAQDRFEYILNNLSSSERNKMENLSSLRALAWAADWRVDNPQIIPAQGVARTKDNYETMEEYIARMKAAYKKQFKKDYPSN